MTAMDSARALSWLRAAFGAAALVAPKLSARLWTGRAKHLDLVALGLSGMGIRDLAVGLGAARAATPQEAAAWMSACALIDLLDTAALTLARRRLPALRGLVLIFMAASGAVIELRLADRLRRA